MTFKSTLSLCAATLTAFAAAQGAPDFDHWNGKPAPRFKMTDTRGRTLTNTSLKGKVVLLDFWATWCAPCKKASPAMERLAEKYGSSGLVVIGAETPGEGTPSGATKYKAEHHYTYTFTVGNDPLKDSFGIAAIPAFVIIDRSGHVARTETGVPNNIDDLYRSFEKTIKPLLR